MRLSGVWGLLVRQHLPRQQGLKLAPHVLFLEQGAPVRQHLPRQQGLKRGYRFKGNGSTPRGSTASSKTTGIETSCRSRSCDPPRVVGSTASSKTTGIETSNYYIGQAWMGRGCSTASSKTTGIETAGAGQAATDAANVRQHLPRQQGLKPDPAQLPCSKEYVSSTASSKTTGIETCWY